MTTEETVLTTEADRDQRVWYRAVTEGVKRHPLLIIVGVFFSYLLYEYVTLPSLSTIDRLRVANPTATAFMQDRKARRGTSWKIFHQWIPLSEISPHLVHAVVVAEDGSFYAHEGIDWYEVMESFERNVQEGRVVRGASTITQQLAKNLYLSDSRDPIRKLKEWIIAMRLERSLSKRRILELYLNLIEWGDGIFGAESASQRYFGKSVRELTREEAVRLAAVIPNPLKYRPTDDSRYLSNRTKVIQSYMEVRGW